MNHSENEGGIDKPLLQAETNTQGGETLDIDNEPELDELLNQQNNGALKDHDFALLIEMGFNSVLVTKVNLFLKPQSLEQAIQFMTLENDVYQHNYYERSKSKSKNCFICGYPAEKHQNYNRTSLLDLLIQRQRRNSMPLPGENKKESELDEKDPIIDVEQQENNDDNQCLICYIELTEEEKIKNALKCNHKFCDECWFEYFKEQINNSKVSEIRCMNKGCNTIINGDFITQHISIDEKLLEKYGRFLKKLDVLKNPNKKFCPIPNCEGIAERKKEQEKYVKCDQGHEFCFICLKERQGKKKCQNEIDKDFLLWKKDKIVKKCPQCQMYVEKNHGCNHITCARCQYQWCWLCRGKYTDNHFSVGGGCNGLQFSDNECFQNCFCLFLYKLVVFLGQLLVYWFFSLFVIAFYAGARVFADDLECFPSLLYYISIFFFVIPYEISFSALLTLTIVPILFYWPLLEIIIGFTFDKIRDL